GMRELEATRRRPASADDLVRAFNEMRVALVSALMFLLGNEADARDAALTAFLTCWQDQGGIPDADNLRPWIWRAALDAAKGYQGSALRRGAKPPCGTQAPQVPCARPPFTDDPLGGSEELRRLRAALADLSLDEKEVFLLRQNGQLTYEEIAEIRCCSVGSVRHRMRAALSSLRKLMRESGKV